MNALWADKFGHGMGLALLITIFLGLRLPVICHAPGAQDEQFFAVPGLTVAQEGIPRIPFAPTRRRESLFENADKCLMALPPALFYVQAPFFCVLPAGYPTARIPSLLGGVLAIVLAARFVQVAGGNCSGAILAAGTLALSRPLLFTSTIARPDLLCSVCGVCAILTLWTAGPAPDWKKLIVAGVAAGLGGLFHPFALVFCLQCGVWSLVLPGTMRLRLVRASILTAAVVLTMCLWLPLILMYRDEFVSQFTANVMEKAGPGLFSRLLFPLDSFRNHTRLIGEMMGPWQSGLFVGGAVLGQTALFLRRDPNRFRWLGLIVSSCYLSATVAGIHPTKGYWVYAFLQVSALIGVALSPWLTPVLEGTPIASPIRCLAALIVLIATLFPGGGLRSAAVYLTHWGDPEYHAGNFIRQTLHELPGEGIFYVDYAYVFDVYLSGRETRVCQPREQYWGDAPLTFSYILVATEGVQYDYPAKYGAQLSQSYGSCETPQSCCVHVYVPNKESR